MELPMSTMEEIVFKIVPAFLLLIFSHILLVHPNIVFDSSIRFLALLCFYFGSRRF